MELSTILMNYIYIATSFPCFPLDCLGPIIVESNYTNFPFLVSKVDDAYAAGFQNRTLDLTSMCFCEDQRTNIVKTHV